MLTLACLRPVVTVFDLKAWYKYLLMLSPETIKSKALDGTWYHCIELLPGFVTPGHGFSNVALTRELLRRTEVRDQRCLDIGAMDGLISVLLCRRSAAKVVAYDRPAWTYRDRYLDRIDLIREALGIDFELFSGAPLRSLGEAMARRSTPPFDIVVMSGVLYHVYDPLAILGVARGLLRDGGIMIVETGATLDGDLTMSFNARGRFWTGTTYWLPSVACLDEMLRFFRLEPLDCIHLALGGQPRIGRIAVACRATDRFMPESGDTWLEPNPGRVIDYSEHLDWSRVASDLPPVFYDGSRPDLVRRESAMGIDIWRTVSHRPEWQVSDEQIQLLLNATF
jgi:SAM-dependent methyltransferase